jgi:hypothetical protein
MKECLLEELIEMSVIYFYVVGFDGDMIGFGLREAPTYKTLKYENNE